MILATRCSAQLLIFLFILIVLTAGVMSKTENSDKFVVNVINLDRNVGRWNEMVSNWGSLFELRRFSAKTHRNPVCGLALSQLSLFKAFKKSNDSYLFVMEDDAYPGMCSIELLQQYFKIISKYAYH